MFWGRVTRSRVPHLRTKFIAGVLDSTTEFPKTVAWALTLLKVHVLQKSSWLDALSDCPPLTAVAWGVWLWRKGLETFKTCFFQSVNNGLPNVSTSFLWSNPAGVGVIWRKLFCVFGCRPLKMCLQLLLWLEKDSSFDVVQNTMQGYRLPVGTA